jgi:hypothetical protein
MDLKKHQSDYTLLLRNEAIKYLTRKSKPKSKLESESKSESELKLKLDSELKSKSKSEKETEKPFFLYWATDSTHGPTYASKQFLNSSKRGKKEWLAEKVKIKFV